MLYNWWGENDSLGAGEAQAVAAALNDHGKGWDVQYRRVGPLDNGGLARTYPNHQYTAILYFGHAGSYGSGVSTATDVVAKLKRNGFRAQYFLSGACLGFGGDAAVSSGIAPKAWSTAGWEGVDLSEWLDLVKVCWGEDRLPETVDDGTPGPSGIISDGGEAPLCQTYP